MNALHALAAGVAALLAVLPQAATACTAESGGQRAALVELFTSEGCSSCPPADRWLSELGRTSGAAVVPLAFHVDYWDSIGWPDPFASAAYSERQRQAAARQSSRTVFTPQVLVNGRTLHDWHRTGGSGQALAARSADPSARIRLEARKVADGLRVSVSGAAPGRDLAVFVALYENGLSTSVPAGENAGRRLGHDYVVRAFSGPLAVGADGRFEHAPTLAVPRNARPANLGVAAFVQRLSDGEVLQALRVACAP